MIRFATITGLALAACGPACASPTAAVDAMIERHAAANGVPASLVRGIVKRESGGNPRASHAGNHGLMQIRHATARGMGYRGSASGLLDAETNLTYAVPYLAGAYRAAQGNPRRAMALYQRGYYARGRARAHVPSVVGQYEAASAAIAAASVDPLTGAATGR